MLRQYLEIHEFSVMPENAIVKEPAPIRLPGERDWGQFCEQMSSFSLTFGFLK